MMHIPAAADRGVWTHPDEWEPGTPIYRSGHAEFRWQRRYMFTLHADVPHGRDCSGTNCNEFDGGFLWRSNPDPWNFDDEYGTPPAGPGTEFYGAVIGGAT